MNQRSVLRAVFAALLLAIATGADAQGFGSVSSGARLPDEAEPAVAVPTVEAPTTPAVAPALPATAPTTTVPESAATPPAGATAAAADAAEPFGTAADASGPFGAANAGIESLRAGYEPADTILVRKGERRLYLMRDGRIIAEFPCARAEPDRAQGARRRFPHARGPLPAVAPQSAQRILPLDRRCPTRTTRTGPAREARRAIRAASIMIHGQPNVPRKPPDYYANYDWTDGCIAVSNSDMVESGCGPSPARASRSALMRRAEVLGRRQPTSPSPSTPA